MSTTSADQTEERRYVTAELPTTAPREVVFELIADPSLQPLWDGNDNLQHAEGGQRVRAVGDVFRMTNADGTQRDNTVVEFAEGERIFWKPAPVGEHARGHIWGWEIEPDAAGEGLTVRHVYDWRQLTDETRFARARQMTEPVLLASLTKLVALAERLGTVDEVAKLRG